HSPLLPRHERSAIAMAKEEPSRKTGPKSSSNKKSNNSEKSKRSKSKSHGDTVSKDDGSLRPPSDRDMEILKRRSREKIEEDKKAEDEKDDKEKKDEKQAEMSKEGAMVVDGIQTTEHSPLLKSEEKTKDAQGGQDLVPGESRQSVTGIRGQELKRLSYTSIFVLFLELLLCLIAFGLLLSEHVPMGPRVLISLNLFLLFLSIASLIVVLFARFHVTLVENESHSKYVVTCGKRFLLFSSHSLRFFTTISSLIMSVILSPPSWSLFGLSLPLIGLSAVHCVYTLRMQPVLPPICRS
ncbi:hypothetical protein PFISCL1PPCAC_22661, partial [Pristionchus fissidentatus]